MKHIATTIENELYFDLIRIKNERTWSQFFQDIVNENKQA